MIEVENLSVTHGAFRALDRVSLSLRPGRPMVVIGESGAGKSTLARAMVGLSTGRVSGSVRIGDEDVTRLDERRLRRIRGRRVALVVQATGDALNPHLRVIDQVADAVTAHFPVSRAEAERRARAALAARGLPEEIATRFPRGLSGGETQRILLAAALVNDPELLILDEPTAALDPDNRRAALDEILRLSAGRHLLLITHDIDAAREAAAEIAVLYAGRLLEIGPAERVFASPRHPYTRALLRASPDRRAGGKDLQGVPGRLERVDRGCVFAGRCPQVIPACREERPDLRPVRPGDDHETACARGGIVAAVAVRGLHKSFDGRAVLRDLDITVESGETVAILGRSGGGKSTLARVLAGLETFDSGRIETDPEAGGGVALVPQHPLTALAPHFTVEEAVEEPLLFVPGVDARERSRRVTRRLDWTQLPLEEGFRRRPVHALSGGELQRVAIARALITRPALLVADEPTSALDVSVQAKIVRLLLDLQERRGLAILFVTHDEALARRVADRIMRMDGGRLHPVAPFTA